MAIAGNQFCLNFKIGRSPADLSLVLFYCNIILRKGNSKCTATGHRCLSI
ncbi:hypothetical protein AVDCRST_MAG84-7285 [uncultured Microcoleus sp.]|uniref:Uncharacterized protein n=1 Tax=uncultured Microcoleus sp. TaxID=259945 RepID=A0A6J4PY73_9CYAN|nr:hypothetical protein AVDCRST_MAG84-7285 [uncultured Microcoleus sp.]